MKKQLLINTLTFEVHDEIYDGCCDFDLGNHCFDIDRKANTIVFTDFDNDGQEQTLTLGQIKCANC